MTKRIMLSRANQFEIGDEIRKRCRKDAGGYAVYDEGWDDARIFEMYSIKFPVSMVNIKNLRRELIGDIRSVTRADTVSKLEEEVAMLRRRLFVLEQWATHRLKDAFKPEVVMPTK